MERSTSWRALFAVTACLVTVAAWAATTTDDPKKPAADPKQAAQKPAAPKANADEVAAIVNGQKIMLSELLARIDELGVAESKREEVAASVLDALIDNTLLMQFLATQKVAYDAKKVDASIAQLRTETEKQGGNFAASLAKIGMDEAKLRAYTISQLQWENYLAKRVSDKEAADYLAKHRDFFDGSEVRTSHILIEVAADAKPADRAAAKKKLEAIKKELPAGLGFTAAAKKYSDCPSKEQGGDVGWFPRRGKMVEPFAKAAFALKVGQMSDVIESEFGYHLILVNDRRAGRNVSIDDAAIKSEILDILGTPIKDSILAEQRKVAKIVIAPDVPDAPKAKVAEQPGKNKTKK